jgi:hypothetical protein
MGFHPELSAERLELLASQEAKDDLHLLADRPSWPGPEVPDPFAVHRLECHLGPPRFGVQRSRVRVTGNPIADARHQHAGGKLEHLQQGEDERA